MTVPFVSTSHQQRPREWASRALSVRPSRSASPSEQNRSARASPSGRAACHTSISSQSFLSLSPCSSSLELSSQTQCATWYAYHVEKLLLTSFLHLPSYSSCNFRKNAQKHRLTHTSELRARLPVSVQATSSHQITTGPHGSRKTLCTRRALAADRGPASIFHMCVHRHSYAGASRRSCALPVRGADGKTRTHATRSSRGGREKSHAPCCCSEVVVVVVVVVTPPPKFGRCACSSRR